MEIGIAQQPKAGNMISGDAPLVREIPPRVVVALSDGLGSGEKASHSSILAMQGVAEHLQEALTDILAYCHYSILAAGGVGVMMTLLRLDSSAHCLEYAGVGNIRFLAQSHSVIQPITRYGYLGVRLPGLHLLRYSYAPGDLFILHTDGISSRFHLVHHARDLELGAQPLAERVLAEYRKEHDDATVVVIRT
jgi:negative regulator of sigma-B (phosphoserine phosphatase)